MKQKFTINILYGVFESKIWKEVGILKNYGFMKNKSLVG